MTEITNRDIEGDNQMNPTPEFMADRAALGLDTTPIDPALIHRTH